MTLFRLAPLVRGWLAAIAIALLPASQALADPDQVRAAFERFVAAQNAHDLKALEGVLVDAPQFLWITRGMVLWGREVALKRFGTLYEGTWQLAPERERMRILMLSPEVAQLHVPVNFTIAAPGQAPQASRLYINQILVRNDGTWKVASIFPVPAPQP